MNEHKICFIIYVRNQDHYQGLLQSLGQLRIPEGMEGEFVTVTEANSLAEAYNEGMNSSDAKYKVYLYDYIRIKNPDFVKDLVEIFLANDEVGALGVSGAIMLPTSGIGWQALRRLGKIHGLNGAQDYEWNQPSQMYAVVQSVDEFFFATQYDLKWRSDLFHKDSFVIAAQSVEYQRAKWEVGVVRQEQPWCSYIGELFFTDKDMQKIFLEEYTKDIFPLVSVLIPTYNRPDYLRIGLESVLQQTYSNLEIIIGDDSTNDETKKMLRPYLKKYPNIKYIDNHGPLGKRGAINFHRLTRLAQGEYINYLMDDDIFHPQKIQIMMDCYLQLEGISLVTSARSFIDEKGAVVKDTPLYAHCPESDTRYEGETFAHYMLFNFHNLCGEPTTPLIRRDLLSAPYGKSVKSFGTYCGLQFGELCDCIEWMHLCQQGDVIFLSEKLSSFRIKGDRKSNNIHVILSTTIDWFVAISVSYLRGFYIKDKEEYCQLCDQWITAFLPLHEAYGHFLSQIPDLEEIWTFYKRIFDFISRKCYNEAFDLFVKRMGEISEAYKVLEKYCEKDSKTGLWKKVK